MFGDFSKTGLSISREEFARSPKTFVCQLALIFIDLVRKRISQAVRGPILQTLVTQLRKPNYKNLNPEAIMFKDSFPGKNGGDKTRHP